MNSHLLPRLTIIRNQHIEFLIILYFHTDFDLFVGHDSSIEKIDFEVNTCINVSILLDNSTFIVVVHDAIMTDRTTIIAKLVNKTNTKC